MAGTKILVVDDEKKIIKVLQAYLEKEGYLVTTAYDGETAIQAVREEEPHLVVLDLMLPLSSGEEICQQLRQEGNNVPIIMLTAKSDLDDKVYGLAVGADDYVTKPFSPQEIVARIKTILRRSSTGEEPLSDIFSLAGGKLHIDALAHKVTWEGQLLELTPSEFKILEVLARHRGRVFSRDQLTESVFGYAYSGYDRTIDVHVKNIRRKFKQANAPSFIKTIYGVGYKFEEN